MAIELLTKPRILLGQWDVTGDSNACALKHGRDQKENSTFGMAAKSRLGGLYDVSAQVSGFWSGDVSATLGATDKAFDRIAVVTDEPVLIGPNNYGADGELCYIFPAAYAKYEAGGQIGEVFPYSVDIEGGTDRLVRGTIMCSVVDASNVAITRNASGNGTARQLGAAAAPLRVWIAVHVPVCGGGNLTIVVKSSAVVGMTGPTTLATWGPYNAPGSQFFVVAGSANTYYRVDWTITAGSHSFAVGVGIL